MNKPPVRPTSSGGFRLPEQAEQDAFDLPDTVPGTDHLPAAPARTSAALPRTVDQALFRLEAVEARRSQWMGTVLLTPRSSHRWFTWFALTAVAALVALLALGEFTRKARVNGWLVPEQGLVRVVAQAGGVVSELKVKEGSVVRQGDPLVVLSSERQSSALGGTEAEVARLLASRRSSYEQEIAQQNQQLAQQRAGLARRIKAIRAEVRQFDEEIAVQAARAKLARSSAQRMRELGEQGFASRMQVQQQEENELDQNGRFQALQRTRAERERELVTLQAEYDDLPFRAQSQVATLGRSMAEMAQELAESEARRQVVIEAPQDGTVTAIQADLGSAAAANAPLLTIVPAGAKLEAHLFTPSRSIGFVQPGQPVTLRYQAYPYQKFGHASGRVKTVSKSTLLPGELSPQITALANAEGRDEPIYRVVVELERQSITAYGQEQALQPGMQLESDILMERRKLYEWVLEPLYTVTGRL